MHQLIEETKQEEKSVYRVAVWWPRYGEYGGYREFDNQADAMKEWAETKALGYEHVHVIKRTIIAE